MDELIRRYDAEPDGDLMLCRPRGVAYQRDMRQRCPAGINAAGENYVDHYAALAGSEIARKIHAGRVAMVDRHVGPDRRVLDVGIGCGEFVEARPNTWGCDVNPRAQAWLRARNLEGAVIDFDAYTFWDVLEHIDVPSRYFRHMPDGCWLLASLPVIGDLDRVRRSKHYKPGEHLYYWTRDGFVDWMARHRFRLLEADNNETRAGREGILSFAFRRDLPTYHDTIGQYRQLYEPNYGASAYLYFDLIAREVMEIDPPSIIDWGCGRSDLAAHFWADGRRRIAKYDPAIPQFESVPEGSFGLALCTDVLEHILMGDVDRVLREIRAKAARALFTISLIPARKRLPDGRNAHVTLLTASEWLRWIESVFGAARRIASPWDHVLMVRTW
jgi:hypothetical protein